jgi:hypothetical protein
MTYIAQYQGALQYRCSQNCRVEGYFNQDFFAGFNLVFPETLEDRSSVQKLLNHAQYDGGGFR